MRKKIYLLYIYANLRCSQGLADSTPHYNKLGQEWELFSIILGTNYQMRGQSIEIRE